MLCVIRNFSDLTFMIQQFLDGIYNISHHLHTQLSVSAAITFQNSILLDPPEEWRARRRHGRALMSGDSSFLACPHE